MEGRKRQKIAGGLITGGALGLFALELFFIFNYGTGLSQRLSSLFLGPWWGTEPLTAILRLPWSPIILIFIAWCGFRILKGNVPSYISKTISILGLWIWVAFIVEKLGVFYYRVNSPGVNILNLVLLIGTGIYIYTQYKHLFLPMLPQTGEKTVTGTIDSAASGNANILDPQSGFFSFRKMVSTAIIKLLYILGMLALTIGGLGGILSGDDEGTIWGLLALTIGNLLWRLICEGWILLFSIHDILGSIEGQLKNRQ